MSHPLLERVRSVGRSGRRLMLVYGISCVLTVVTAAALLLGLADYVLRFSDVGVRWLCFGAVGAAWAFGAYFFLLPAIRFRRTEIQIARLIERRFPSLGDQLSSTVAFLGQSEQDVKAGSAALRRMVIADTAANLQQLDLRSTISRRIPLRAFAAALLVCGLVAGVFLADPASSSLAARRLIAPWNQQSWPRRNQLQFVGTPKQLATTADFSVEVIDKNERLPDAVSFEYRWKGEAQIHVKPMKLNRNSLRYGYQLTNVDRSLEYRAVGGDDVTPWHDLTVVAPAQVTSLDVTIQPPRYTGWAAEQSDGHIRALVGSRVALRAQVSVPLSQVVVRFDDNSETTEIPVSLSQDGLSFQVGVGQASPWIISKSGHYRFEMTERENPVDARPREFEVHAVADMPPKILLEQPDKHSYVTRNAVVALRGTVEDDLGIQTVDLEYWNGTPSADTQQSSIPLFRQASPDNPAENSAADGSNPTTAFLLDYQWNLARLNWLRPGMTVAFRPAARDYKPQSSEFESRQISIISVEELLDRIGRRQSYILEQLADALRDQRDARIDVGEILLQLSGESAAYAAPIDQLQGVELRQRRVQQALVGRRPGVTDELEGLIRQLDANQVDDPGLKRNLMEMLMEVRRIDREHLTLVQRELVQSIEQTRQLQAQADVDTALIEQLNQAVQRAGQQQDLVIASLERMIGDLSQWDGFQRVARELRYLRQQQEAVADDTEKHRVQTIGKDLSDLTTQQQTELRKLEMRQSLLAREFEKLIGGMSRMRADLAETQPLVAQALGDAMEAAARQGIGAKLRDAAAAVKDNRVSTAVQRQREVIDQLQEMLDVLSNRSENELGRRIEHLAEAAQELENLREQVESLDQQMDAAQSLADPQQRSRELQRLDKARKDAAQQLDQLARRLARLQAEKASAATAEAAGAVEKSDNQDAGSQDEPLKQATKHLEEAGKQLREDLGRLRQELARQQMIKLEQQIAGLAAQQRALIDRTGELHEILASNGELSRGQRLTVVEMSRQQRNLALQTNSLAANFAQSEAFRLALGGAAREMLRATGRLGRGQLGSETQQNQQVALRRLEQLIEALKQDDPDPNAEPSPPPGELGELAPEEAVRLLAELKLLKLMQAEVQRRTIELEMKREQAGGSLTEQQQLELRELASEQGRLADLMLNLSKPSGAGPEDDPASL